MGDKVVSYQHDRCATFGAGRSLSIKQWQYLVSQFLEQNILSKDEAYGVLKLNRLSYEVLSNKRAVRGYRLAATSETVVKSSVAEYSRDSDNYDKDLFELLRQRRKYLADQRGVPPYVIFSDKSLIDMCQKKPKNKTEFASIYGVGEQKLAQFADIFIKEINMLRKRMG
jgi:ATP-dependent DNA helicase RecQ